MKERFLQFQSFNDIALAGQMSEWLSQHQIQSIIEDNSPSLDPVIIGNGLDTNIILKLKPEDFTRAHQALEQYYLEQINTINDDYYLFSFSNEELKSVLEQPFEWSYFDLLLAGKILTQRGIEVTTEELSNLKQQNLKKIAAPEKLKTPWILLGYLFAFLLSIVGIFYGACIIAFRKALPDGRSIYVYDRTSRMHGTAILIISLVLALVGTLFNAFRFSPLFTL
jgi:hypothetical protein